MNPLVSVIIPAYNAQAFLRPTLDSVLAQTYQNLEILVVDDGSCDRTVEIVQAYAAKDDRIRLIQQTNAGVAAARNRGIQTAKGEFIAPLDADDIWYPEKIEKQVACFLAAKPSVGLVYTWSVNIDGDGRIRSPLSWEVLQGKVLTALTYCNFIANASVPLIRRSCFERVGLYNPQLKAQNAQGCEDFDLYLRIAEHYEFRVVPQFLMGYRRAAGSMSSGCEAMAKSYHLVQAKIRQKYPQIPAMIYRWSDSDFYAYLARQGELSRCYRESWLWMTKAFWIDPVNLLSLSSCKLWLRSLIRLIGQIFVQNEPTQAKTNLGSKATEFAEDRSICELEAMIQMPNPWWKLYPRVRNWRWQRVIQANQSIVLTSSADPAQALPSSLLMSQGQDV